MLYFSVKEDTPRTSGCCPPGGILGDFVAMTISLLGAGAVLSSSATLFFVLKIAGAGYLVWLGIGLWRTDAAPLRMKAPSERQNRRSVFRQAFLVTALNPKDIVFFVAFLPQFVDPAGAALPQLVTIGTTFLIMVAISTSLWIALSGKLRNSLKSAAGLKRINRLGAISLIGAGSFTALAR
jgi:threonine/homoserine/homoserine lactone efflux protein